MIVAIVIVLIINGIININKIENKRNQILNNYKNEQKKTITKTQSIKR